MEDRFLLPGAAAQYLGITSRHLAKLRRAGDGPRAYCRKGSQPRYLLSELDAWAKGRQAPESSAGGAFTASAAGAAG